MSNFVFNDNFGGQPNGQEPITVLYKTPEPAPAKTKKSPALFICTGIMILAGILFLIGGAFILTATLIKNDYAPQITNTTTYVSEEERAPVTPSTGGTLVEVIADIKDSVVEISTAAGSAGSGVIVGKYDDEKGNKGYLIITNAHVVVSESSFMSVPTYVTLTNGTKYKTTLCGKDERSDIAVLRIEENEKELKCATWANDKTQLNVGESVIAIGNPLGVFGGTITVGHLSALDRAITVEGNTMNLLQTDAAVNPGNSGGGLFNAHGELIGIVNAKIADENIEGLGFAIPYKDAYKSYNDLVNYGYVKGRPTIGATFTTNQRGYVEVTDVEPGSVLKAGDIIRAIKLEDSNAFVNVDEASLSSYIRNMEIGEKFQLRITRSGFSTIVTVTVFEYTE